jgi:CCR4-NOT complex subunit CAF16
MHRVSDGQRRRVQLLLALLHPKRVLLLDEATSDLDVLARLDLLDLLQKDTAQYGTAIVYATHVFDRLERWASHLLWLEAGRVRFIGTLAEALGTEIKAGDLLQHVESGLRA